MRILVYNIPPRFTEGELHDLFEKHGEVISVRIVHDHISGRPTGFGFLEMPNRTQGEAAIAAIDGIDMMDHIPYK